MKTKLSEWRRWNHTDGTFRQKLFSALHAGILHRKSARAWCVAGIIGCVVVLVLGLGEHYGTVVPLEKELLSREVRGLADEIDALVRLKTAVITTAAGIVEVDALVENGPLESFLRTLRERLPHFRSLEIINDRGEIVAMIGELPLSEAVSAGPVRASRFVRVGSDINYNEGLFFDDPANGSFSITCRHIAPQKGQWFSKSRFSRESVERILSSVPNRQAALIPVAGVSKTTRKNKELEFATTSGSWWSGPSKAEALLTSPGWMVRLENTATGSVISSLCVLPPSLLLILAGISYLVHMFVCRKTDAVPEEDAAVPHAVSCEAGLQLMHDTSHAMPEPGAHAHAGSFGTSTGDSTEVQVADEFSHDASKGGGSEAGEKSAPPKPDEDLLGPSQGPVAFECDSQDDAFFGCDRSVTDPLPEVEPFGPQTDAVREESLKLLAAAASTSDLSGHEELVQVLEGAAPQEPPAKAENGSVFHPEALELVEDHFACLVASSEVTVVEPAKSPKVAEESEAATQETGFEPEAMLFDPAAPSAEQSEPHVSEPFPTELEMPEDYFAADDTEEQHPETGPCYSAVILGPPTGAEKEFSEEQTAAQLSANAVVPTTLELSWTESSDETSTSAPRPRQAAESPEDARAANEVDFPDSLEVSWLEPDQENQSCEKSEKTPVHRGQYTAC